MQVRRLGCCALVWAVLGSPGGKAAADETRGGRLPWQPLRPRVWLMPRPGLHLPLADPAPSSTAGRSAAELTRQLERVVKLLTGSGSRNGDVRPGLMTSPGLGFGLIGSFR
jgi:hypothetical protein